MQGEVWSRDDNSDIMNRNSQISEYGALAPSTARQDLNSYQSFNLKRGGHDSMIVGYADNNKMLHDFGWGRVESSENMPSNLVTI